MILAVTREVRVNGNHQCPTVKSSNTSIKAEQTDFHYKNITFWVDLLLPWVNLFLLWAICFCCEWLICFCRDSCGPPYIYRYNPLDRNISSTTTLVHRTMVHMQGATQIVSDSPGLADLPIGLVDFSDNLPDGQANSQASLKSSKDRKANYQFSRSTQYSLNKSVSE